MAELGTSSNEKVIKAWDKFIGIFLLIIRQAMYLLIL
jgi:hypothetical protein